MGYPRGRSINALESAFVGSLAVAMLSLAAGDGETAERDEYCSDAGTNVVLYLDVTTPYDAIDRASVIDGIEKIFATLGDGDRLSIRTIEDSFPRSRRLVDACMPFCKSEGFLSDLLSSCTEGVVIDETRRLQQDVVDAIKKVAGNSVELAHSEIIRTLAMSAAEEFREGHANRFFVFSDMIENSEYLPSGQFLSLDNTVIIDHLTRDRLVPNLRDASVRIFGIGRKGNPDAREALEQQKVEKIADFWEGFFSLTGATMTLQPNLGTLR